MNFAASDNLSPRFTSPKSTMSKTLLVMRHAKSSWKQPGLTDHQRPLNKRGLGDAVRMARWLFDQNLVPQHIFHSSATRTTMTSTLMNERFEALGTPPVSITEVDDFYLAKWKVYIKELSTLLQPDSPETVMVLGHCPGVENLVEALTDQWVTMPTAAIARLSYNHDSWSKLKSKHRNHFQLEDLWLPKEVLE